MYRAVPNLIQRQYWPGRVSDTGTRYCHRHHSKGYVAGVTNPLFEQRSQWWDVLCNVQTGEVTVAPEFQVRGPDQCGR